MKTNKGILILLLLISVLVFIGLWKPNATGAENHPMVQVFEPDEAAQASVVDRMTSPKPSMKSFLDAFISYDYYHYGFPFFGISSLPVFVLRALDQYENTPLTMVVLRQLISLLPTLIALLLLTYMVDGFQSYRSILIYLLMLSIPAVLANNLWWHPDGLVLLLTILALFFLWKDEGKLGKNFYFAAIFSGILTATKLIGIYFYVPALFFAFLAWKNGQRSAASAFKNVVIFVLISAAAFVVANPFVFNPASLIKYLGTIYRQVTVLSKGYGVIYESGWTSAWSVISSFYGYWYFLLIAFLSMLYGLTLPAKKHLHLVILTWFLPLSLTVIFGTHLKFQYWLPAALPMIACLVVFMPDRSTWQGKDRLWKVGTVLVMVILLAQGFSNAINARSRIDHQLNREVNNQEIQFYYLALELLEPLDELRPHVYYDYRLYMPYVNPWSFETSYDLLDYRYIEQSDFDVLLLLNQRILDYTQDGLQGTDPLTFPESQRFYTDAKNETVEGFKLLYRNNTALIFVKESLCAHFPAGSCK